MKILLDTHTFLWWLIEDRRISQKASEIIMPILTNDGHIAKYDVRTIW